MHEITKMETSSFRLQLALHLIFLHLWLQAVTYPCVCHAVHSQDPHSDTFRCRAGIIISNCLCLWQRFKKRVVTSSNMSLFIFCIVACPLHLVPLCEITRFCHSWSDETQKSLMIITVIACRFVSLPLSYHFQSTPSHSPILINLPSAEFPRVFSCNYAELHVIGFHGEFLR